MKNAIKGFPFEEYHVEQTPCGFIRIVHGKDDPQKVCNELLILGTRLITRHPEWTRNQLRDEITVRYYKAIDSRILEFILDTLQKISIEISSFSRKTNYGEEENNGK